jgi:hypothetical protein
LEKVVLAVQVVHNPRKVNMTDYEMTKLCAEARGYKVDGITPSGKLLVWENPNTHFSYGHDYWPLTNDREAEGVRAHFGLSVTERRPGLWEARHITQETASTKRLTEAFGCDRNRAIVECAANVAKYVADSAMPKPAEPFHVGKVTLSYGPDGSERSGTTLAELERRVAWLEGRQVITEWPGRWVWQTKSYRGFGGEL